MHQVERTRAIPWMGRLNAIRDGLAEMAHKFQLALTEQAKIDTDEVEFGLSRVSDTNCFVMTIVVHKHTLAIGAVLQMCMYGCMCMYACFCIYMCVFVCAHSYAWPDTFEDPCLVVWTNQIAD